MTNWTRDFTDSFTRANSATVGNGWIQVGGGTKFSIVSNELSGLQTIDATNTTDFLVRPATSNPASLVPGTNEGSINQRALVYVDNMAVNKGMMVMLRTNATGTRGYGFLLFGSNSVYGFATVSNALGGLWSETFTMPFGCNLADPVKIDFSAVSTDATHTDLTVSIIHVPSGLVVYTKTVVGDTTTGLQSGTVGTSTYGFSGYGSAAGGSWTVKQVDFLTDQAVTVSSALVSPTLNAASVTANSVSITQNTAASGGTSSYSYQWFRSTVTPSGENYGVQLAGRTSTSMRDAGLQCAKTYYYTLRTTDSTSINPQVVYSTPVLATTSTAPTSDNPGTRSSLIMWADADQLIGQTNGSAIVGNFGQFSNGLKSTSVLPNYSAAGMPGSNAALTFDGSHFMYLEPGVDTDIEQALIGSFTATVVFNRASGGATYESILSKLGTAGGNANLAIWTQFLGLLYAPTNFDSISGNTKMSAIFADVTSPGTGAAANPIAIAQVSFNSSTNTMIVGGSDGNFSTYTVTPYQSAVFPLCLGALTDPGSATTNTVQHIGKVSQVVIYNTALSQAQLIVEQGYFRRRYGVNVGKTVINCVGDSRTYGYDNSGYPNTASNRTNFPFPLQLQGLVPNTVINNYGVSGQTTAGIVPGQIEYISGAHSNILTDDPTRPVIVIVPMIGVNDFHGSVAVGTASTNIESVITSIEAMNGSGQFSWKTIYCSEIDQNYASDEAAWNTYRNTLKSNLTGTLGTSSIRKYCDLSIVTGVGLSGSTSNVQKWCLDQIHPTGENSTGVMGGGYGDIAAALATIVSPMLPATGLTAGIASTGSTTASTASATATDATSGTLPYAYQWFRSLSAGTLGSAVSGQISLTLSDSGLSPSTTYYYTLRYTDSAGTPGVVYSNQITETTSASTGPYLNISF